MALARTNQLRSEEIRAYACLHGSAQLKSMPDKATAFNYRTHLLDLHRQQADQNNDQQKNESLAMLVVINLNSNKATTSERKD